jgi:hypothetical protein
MPMNVEFIITVLIMIPAAFLSFVLYVASLLYVARTLSGVIKGVFAALIYGAFSVLIIFPLVHLININQPELMQGNNELLAIILVSYVVVVAPGFYYLFCKLGALRNAGYFKLRGQ